MYAATIASLVTAYKGIFPFVVGGQVAYCPMSEDSRCSYEAISNGSGEVLLYSGTYDQCLCRSTCGAITPDYAPLRKGSSLQALLLNDGSDKILSKNTFRSLDYVNLVFLVFIIAHGVLGVIEARWTQARVRNSVFRFLNGTTSRKNRRNFFPRRSTSSILCYHTAKFIAGSFFGNAVLAAIICPPLFVSSLIVNEIAAWDWPVRYGQSSKTIQRVPMLILRAVRTSML